MEEGALGLLAVAELAEGVAGPHLLAELGHHLLRRLQPPEGPHRQRSVESPDSARTVSTEPR